VYWIKCTVCGPDGDTLERESEDALWAELLGLPDEGWVRLDDGRILCPAHYRASRCQKHGHVLVPWTGHPLDDQLEWRYCHRCGSRFEQRVIGRPTYGGSGPE
jgi:hypothetical protein